MTIKGQSEELVSRCVECDLAEPESLASLGGSAPGVVDGILLTRPRTTPSSTSDSRVRLLPSPLTTETSLKGCFQHPSLKLETF